MFSLLTQKFSLAQPITLLLLAVLVTGCQDQPADSPSPQQSAPDTSTTGSIEPTSRDTADWQVRPDQSAAGRSDITFKPSSDTLRITSGPAAIYYHPADTASAPFSVSAQFTQLQRTEHPESYGLFFGGSDLEGSNQRYTYFLVRQDGNFLIKRRTGSKTSIIQNWSPHPAVHAMDEESLTNELAISVERDSMRFEVNGETVTARPHLERIQESGQVGLRVNHRLDLKVSDFQVSSDT